MKNNIKISSLIISFTLLIVLSIVNVTAVYSWFNGQGYSGKTMSYSRSLYIGAVDSHITNYYGYADGLGNFIYTEIDPEVGFQRNSLIPGSFVHIRTDIDNESVDSSMYISIYLQDVIYDEALHDYLYFGTNDPVIKKESFKELAIFNGQTNKYTLRSIPLLTNYTVQPDESISLYWYLYIDSDAGMEIANTYINLGTVTVVYN